MPELPDLSLVFAQVTPAYHHRQKCVRPGAALVTDEVYLKWYDIAREEMPIADDLIADARSFLLTELHEGRLPLQQEVGFAIHHQCGSLYILYICTWRNDNEVWEILYHKDLAGDGTFRRFEREATTPTFCVWVLGPVWHEQQAWVRYLNSARDDAARWTYLHDQMVGLV
jgi:hypothetical protein